MSTDPLAVARLCADYNTRIAALEAELAVRTRERDEARDCLSASADRIAALMGEALEWRKVADAHLDSVRALEAELAAVKGAHDIRCRELADACGNVLAERERREAAEEILRDVSNAVEGHWLALDVDAHFARYKVRGGRY